MDKNMIHIDDLIKQRLVGEEDERPGAWLHMKDLLDRNMPTSKVPAAFNWRRMMTYAGVILAIGAVGVGGYEASTGFRNSGDGLAKQANNALSTEATTNVVENTVTVNKANTSLNNNNSNNENTPVEPAAAVTGNSTDATKTPSENELKTNTAGSSIAGSKTERNNKNFSSNARSATENETIAKVNDKAAGLVTDKPAQPKNTAKKSTTSNSDKNQDKASNTSQKTAAGNDLNNAQQPGTRKKDSIPMIALVQKMHIDNRTRKAYFTEEQIASGNVALERIVPSNIPALIAAKEEAAVQEPALIPAHAFVGPIQEDTYAAAAPKSNAPSIAHNSGNVNLERKKEKKGLNFQAISNMLRDAKDRLSNMQVQHSQGFIGGINATFGTPAFFGFQLGLYENIRFNENWSMQVEGKYMQRFNGVTLQDNYTTYNKEADGKYTENLVEHRFKYNSLSSFEVPLMVRYNTSDAKWNFFAGGSAIYNMAIKNEEISQSNPVKTGLVFAQEPVNGAPKVTQNDFAARLGLGYLVGVSYNITPKAQIDARFTQSVWDNAQGAGQQKISNSLYRAPSAQISFGWRFGKDKEKK